MVAMNIEEFHSKNLGLLTVGSPVGPLTRGANDSFHQSYTFGSIVKPLNHPPEIASRFLVLLEVAGIRCFGTDDPSGTDEPYLISTVYALDPIRGEESLQTIRIGPDDIGPISPPKVFAQGRQLVDKGKAFFIPGDGEIRIHLALFDAENGDPNEIKNKMSSSAQVALGAAIAAIPGIGPAAAVLAKSSGLLEIASNDIGELVSDLLADDLIDQHDFVVHSNLLLAAARDAQSLHRTSDSIPGIAYNFPQLKEDDSAEGRSWLFDRGSGKGTYRIFLGLRVVEVPAFPDV
jgi:hypothetical protein